MKYELMLCATCRGKTVHYGKEGSENCIRCQPLPSEVLGRVSEAVYWDLKRREGIHRNLWKARN